MKKAVVRPLLKKASLDPNILKNYRPVSNLPYISKLLERVVAARLNALMIQHHLHEPLQSAYKSYHSTETALIRVHNDVLSAMDKQQVTILVLLDLSSAFDTIDHTVLLDRMQQRIGVSGVIHDWFASYLTDRSQSVCIEQIFSLALLLLFGVPQGSVLGPLLFLIYMLPLGDVIRRHGFLLHIFADDTQIYISISPDNIVSSVLNIEACVADIHSWMSANFLKLNSDKTEILILGTWQQLAKCTVDSISVAGTDVILQNKPVRNLGVMFDKNMTMSSHVSSVVKSVSFQIRNVAKIRRYLPVDAAKKLVNAVVTSRLDYCNALLSGVSGYLVKRLQKVQHSAARLISGLKRHDHITDTLIDLHWLPIKYRIDFKIALIAFKALHGQAPEYISDLLVEQSAARSPRSAHQHRLYVPKTRLPTAGDRTFRARAPTLWNSLPLHVRACDDVQTFKKKLKTHYFNHAMTHYLKKC